MSWSKVFAGACALLLAGGLSGCFQPLYGEAAHPGLVEDLRAIEVAPIPNRVGHYLAEDLIADLNGTGQTTSQPKYRLVVTISLGTQTPTVNSEINVATSATVTGDASYTLTKVDGGSVVLQGHRERGGGLRPHDAALRRSARRAGRRDPHCARPFVGDLASPRHGARGEDLLRGLSRLSLRRCSFTSCSGWRFSRRRSSPRP